MSRKSDYIWLCVSHKCAGGTVILPSGETQAGRFVSCQTLNNHCKADEALYMRDEGLQSVDSSAGNVALLECTLTI